MPAPTAPNTLYYGDNLDVLRKHVKDESVDLIYLDPPFKSDQNYNVLFQERDGSRAVAQVQAFDDTWHWDAQAVESYRRTVECGGRLGEAMAAFRLLVGDSDMLAYLAMMAPRLVEMHRVLRPTGSLYLHCDPTASHYLKLLLDAVFGPSLFRNEIVWKRTHAHGSAKRYGPVHDVILYYSREGGGTWTDPRLPHQTDYVTRRFTNIDGESGRAFQPITLTGAGARNGDSGKPWRGINPTDVNRHWAIPKAAVAAANIQGETVQDRLDALDAAGWIHWPEKAGGTPRLKWFADALDGVAVPDVWTDLPPIASNAAERLGYQTQKPLALLERIISASSKPGDVVLDPFCGCGTAVEASQKLGRRWVGIDIAQVAIGIISRRVESRCGLQPKKDYKVVGQPVSLPDARALAIQDRFEFQFWVVNLLAGRPVEQKKGKDKGIDGKIHFHDEPDSGPTKTVLISVKSGKVGPEVVRELRGVIERDKAAIGVLVLLDDPTRDMRAEAAEAGKYRSPVWGRNYPRLQLLTVEEILHAGDRIDMPPLSQTDETFAPRKPVKARGAKKGTPGPALFE